MYIMLAKTCKILDYSDHNMCMFIVTYFIAVCFKEKLVSAPDNSDETCRSYVKDCIREL